MLSAMDSNEKLIQGRENPVQKWINSIHHQKNSESMEDASQSTDVIHCDRVMKKTTRNENQSPASKANSPQLNALNSAYSSFGNMEVTAKSKKHQIDRVKFSAQESVERNEVLEQELRRRLGLCQDNIFTSETSPPFDSLNQILDDRKGDPETILQNLGFSRDCTGIRCRIPDRFLQTSSNANGISIEKFLESNPKLKDYLEEKSVIQNPFEMMVTTPQARLKRRRMGFIGSNSLYQVAVTMTMVNRFKKLVEKKGCMSSVHSRVPLAEPLLQTTKSGCRYWSILPDENRNYLEESGYYDVIWSNSESVNEMLQGQTLYPTEYSVADSFSEIESTRISRSLPAVDHGATESEKNADVSECLGNENFALGANPLISAATSSAVTGRLMVFDKTTENTKISKESSLSSELTVQDKSVKDKISELKLNSCLDKSSFNETFLPLANAYSLSNRTCNDAICPSINCNAEEVASPENNHSEFPAAQMRDPVYEQKGQNFSVYPIEVMTGETHRRFNPVKLKDLPSWFSSTDSEFEVRNSDSAELSSCSCTHAKVCQVPKDPMSVKAKIPSGIIVGPKSPSDLIEDDHGKQMSVVSSSYLRSQFGDNLGKLQKEFSTLSDSSGFADVDQLDVTASSLNDVFEASDKTRTVETSVTSASNSANGIKETLCINLTRPNSSPASRLLNLTNSGVGQQLQIENGNSRIQFTPEFDFRTLNDSDAHEWNKRDVRSFTNQEYFLDLSDHRVLCDQLQTSSSFQALRLNLILKRLGQSTQTITTVSEWIQFFQEETKLMECAMQEYKLTSRRLHLRMSKIVDRREFSDDQDALLSFDCFRQERISSENLQKAIMKEIEVMEEYIVMRMKCLVNLHEGNLHDFLPFGDLSSKDVIQTMSRLLREQTYQTSVVNSLLFATTRSCSLDHCPENRSSLPVTPSSPLLHSPVSMFASSEHLVRLNENVISLTRMLSGMQLNSEHITNENKTSKSKKNYQRLLPSCLKPRWMKK